MFVCLFLYVSVRDIPRGGGGGGGGFSNLCKRVLIYPYLLLQYPGQMY